MILLTFSRIDNDHTIRSRASIKSRSGRSAKNRHAFDVFGIDVGNEIARLSGAGEVVYRRMTHDAARNYANRMD